MIGGSGWGTVFLLLFSAAARLVVTESGCSGNDGAGKLFWGIKNLEFPLFLVGN